MITSCFYAEAFPGSWQVGGVFRQGKVEGRLSGLQGGFRLGFWWFPFDFYRFFLPNRKTVFLSGVMISDPAHVSGTGLGFAGSGLLGRCGKNDLDM